MRTNSCQLVPLQIIERVVTVVSERYWNLRLAPIAANRCCQHCYELYITVLLLITKVFFFSQQCWWHRSVSEKLLWCLQVCWYISSHLVKCLAVDMNGLNKKKILSFVGSCVMPALKNRKATFCDSYFWGQRWTFKYAESLDVFKNMLCIKLWACIHNVMEILWVICLRMLIL